MLHHFATREEELFKIDMVFFKRLTTLLHQGVEGRLKDVALVEDGFIVARVSTLYV
jgi:hypothetical protein